MTDIHPTANIYGNPVIGTGTRIGAFCDIGPVTIGLNCSIQTMVSICKGVLIGNEVFIGPQVVFTNDLNPPSNKMTPTIVEDRVSIGANATIVCGIKLGKGCLIGAGSVVTKSVPPGETWVGNPAHTL